jgi:hypothetical protein
VSGKIQGLSIGVHICAAKVSGNRKQSELLLPAILSRDEPISSVWITTGELTQLFICIIKTNHKQINKSINEILESTA